MFINLVLKLQQEWCDHRLDTSYQTGDEQDVCIFTH